MLTIRDVRLPQDRSTLLGFVDGLQRYEAAFEPNRRLDASFAEEYLAELERDAHAGKLLLAEMRGQAVGWAVVHEKEGPVFVTADERHFAYIAELFVAEPARGQGVGRALIAACEQWARSRGFATIQISHLARNGRAGRVYLEAGYGQYATQLRKRL